MKQFIASIALFALPFIGFSQFLTPSLAKKETSNQNDLEQKFVHFYGLTSLNSTNEEIANSITATGRLAVEFIPRIDSIIRIHVGANLLNANPSKGVKKDSVDFNSLMFPETGNFGFMISPSIRLWQAPSSDGLKNHSLSGELFYAYRKVRLDSFNVDFKVLSYTAGIKYRWDYWPRDAHQFSFSVMLYGNYFNVPDEDVSKFNLVMTDDLFKENNKNAEIRSIGGKVTIQFGSFIFFYDLRRNLGTKNLDDNNPFKGTKSNIGIATAVRIKSF